MIDTVELYFREKAAIADQFPIAETAKLVEAVINCYDNDGCLFICANGGPAGAATGIATDMKTHPFVFSDKSKTTEIRRLRVECLNDSVGVITGISNDIGYEAIFTEQLKNYMRSVDVNQNDVLLGLSGSGNSQNVLSAFEYAKLFGVTTACISGRGGGKAKDVADINVVIPGQSSFPGQRGKNDNNFHIEDFQNAVGHIITGILKQHVGTDT